MLQSGEGEGGMRKAEVMSEADVEWSSESFNVPGLQRNHDDGRGVVRWKVGEDETGRTDRGGY